MEPCEGIVNCCCRGRLKFASFIVGGYSAAKVAEPRHALCGCGKFSLLGHSSPLNKVTATADENEVAETYVDEVVHNPPSESNVGNRESVCGAIPSSSAIHTPLNYVSEVCEMKAAMRQVYDNVNLGRLNRSFKESILRKVNITADWPPSTLHFDVKPFVPYPLREKHSFYVERHIRALLANEQREKRTSYIIEAGADEILSMLHRADPEGLRETCNSLTKRISAARSWCENVPTVENVYKAVIDLDVEDLLTMARLLESKRPRAMQRIFANGIVGPLKSDFVVETLRQLKISHHNPPDLHSMNVRWVVPVELVAVSPAVDAISVRIKAAAEVAQLNGRIEYFIAYHADEILGLRSKHGGVLGEARICKMLSEVVAVNEWRANIPSVSIIAARIDALSTSDLRLLCNSMFVFVIFH
uniref:Uncharacterized protein n=1 Tax=Ascaris lumbricoides TaxID=6252 RepID=A0A9J2P6I0_ASCLU